MPRDAVDPNRADQQADSRRDKSLDSVVAEQNCNAAHSEERHPKVLGRAKQERHGRQRWRKHQKCYAASDASNRGGPGSDAQSIFSFAALCQRDAIERCGNRGGRSRDAEEDCGYGAAVNPAIVYSGHHTQRDERLHREGQWDKYSNSHRRR